MLSFLMPSNSVLSTINTVKTDLLDTLNKDSPKIRQFLGDIFIDEAAKITHNFVALEKIAFDSTDAE